MSNSKKKKRMSRAEQRAAKRVEADESRGERVDPRLSGVTGGRPEERPSSPGEFIDRLSKEHLGGEVGGVEFQPYVDRRRLPSGQKGWGFGIKGRFSKGGLVTARGNKLARSKPTKII